MVTGLRVFAFLFLINALLSCSVSGQEADSNKTANSEPPAPATDPVKQSAPKRVRVNQGVLKPVYRVDPAYPESARVTGADGTVSLKVVIATDGTVKDVQVINGNDLLTPSAISAVKQWRYKPLSVNGSPVEVETQVDVKYKPH